MSKIATVGGLVLAALLAACGDKTGEPEVVLPPPEADAASDADAADAQAEETPSTLTCPSEHFAIVVKRPEPSDKGTMKIAAWIDFPSYSGMTDTAWADPYPGCVAGLQSDKTLTCDFTHVAAYDTMTVYFIAGWGDNSATGAITNYFSELKEDGTLVVLGEYLVCVEGKPVGSYANGKFDGILGPDKDPNGKIKSANLVAKLP